MNCVSREERVVLLGEGGGGRFGTGLASLAKSALQQGWKGPFELGLARYRDVVQSAETD